MVRWWKAGGEEQRPKRSALASFSNCSSSSLSFGLLLGLLLYDDGTTVSSFSFIVELASASVCERKHVAHGFRRSLLLLPHFIKKQRSSFVSASVVRPLPEAACYMEKETTAAYPAIFPAAAIVKEAAAG